MGLIDNDNLMDSSATRVLNLHFGEIAILDSNLTYYTEQFKEGGMYGAMDRTFHPIKDLLLKIGSAYNESFSSRDELDVDVPVSFTEEELWTLQQGVNISANFNGVPVGATLKQKIYEALIDINTVGTDTDFDIDDVLKAAFSSNE